MYAVRKSGLITTGILGLLLCGTFTAAGAERKSSPAPGGAPRFRVGDTMVVTGTNAQLMRGDRAVAAVARGQHILVVEIREGWIGTHVAVNGQTKGGWLAVAEILPAASPVHDPQPTDVATTVCVCESRLVQTGDVDAFLIGKYMRHETDPNIHAWEPWRR